MQLLENCTVLTQNSQRQSLRAHLLIEKNRIVEIFPAKKSLPAKKGIKKISLHGKLVVPGFVQTHLHLCQTLFRNLADDMELLDWLQTRIWPLEAAHTKASLKLSAQIGIQELLSSGTTCILDMGTIRHTETIFEAAIETGVRANIGKCLMDHEHTCPSFLRESTGAAIAESIKLVERFHGTKDDRIRASLAPRFAVSCTEALLQKVAQVSADKDLIIHTHASENKKECELVERLTGHKNLDYFQKLRLLSERLVLAHCVWLSDHDLELLKTSKTNVAHCPGSNLKLASGVAPVPRLLERKINVSLGADGAACNNTLDMFHEMRLAATVHKPGAGPRAMKAQEVFDMATRNGAQALQWNDVGSLEEGKKADFVVLDPLSDLASGLCSEDLEKANGEKLTSALIYAGKPSWVTQTWVDGKTVYDSSKAQNQKTLKALRSQIDRELPKLLQRAAKLKK